MILILFRCINNNTLLILYYYSSSSHDKKNSKTKPKKKKINSIGHRTLREIHLTDKWSGYAGQNAPATVCFPLSPLSRADFGSDRP